MIYYPQAHYQTVFYSMRPIIRLFCFPQAHYETLYYCSVTSKLTTRLFCYPHAKYKTVNYCCATHRSSTKLSITRTTHFIKIQTELESYIFLKSRMLAKFTGVCFAQIGPLVKMLLTLKVGAY